MTGTDDSQVARDGGQPVIATNAPSSPSTNLASLPRSATSATETSDSSASRARERYRRIFLSTLIGVAARFVGLATTIIVTPFAIDLLGVERYGIWLTITATAALLGLANLGLGSGLVNAVADADGRKDIATMRRAVSSAGSALIMLAAAAGALFATVYPFVSWADVFNASSTIGREQAAPALMVFVACFLIGLPLSLAPSTETGLQEIYVKNAFEVLTAVLTIVSVCVAVVCDASLPWFVLATAGPQVAAQATNAVYFFGRRHPELAPRLGSIHRQTALELTQVGFMFFLIQASIAVAFASDAIIVARILGASAVPDYAVPAKLYSFAPMLLGLALTTLWPAYREAFARGDRAWVRKTFRQSLALAICVNGGAVILLLFFHDELLSLWVGSTITATSSVIAGLTAWTLLNCLGGPIAMLLNGAGLIRFQAMCSVCMAAGNIVLSIYLTERIGVAGVIFGSVIAHSVLVVLPSAYVARRHVLPRLPATSCPAST